MSQIGPATPRFQPTASLDRSNESFQGLLFLDLDFREAQQPISFVRGDFRRAKIDNVRFWKSNFDRADFIDAFVRASGFESCAFGSDFLNTYFDGVHFSHNDSDTCTLTDCVYENCTFSSETIVNSTLSACRYKNCIFDSCDLRMNTADTLIFTKCTFRNIDFSNMTAVNFQFADCRFENVRLDPDYLGTYLFKGSAPDNINLTYRGEIVQLNAQYLSSLEVLMDSYANATRYYEVFNCAVLYNYLAQRGKTLLPLFRGVIHSINSEPAFIRKHSADRIIALISFYADSPAIPTNELFTLVAALGDIALDDIPLVDRLQIESKMSFLKNWIQAILLQWQSPRPPEGEAVYFELTIEESDRPKVEVLLKGFFEGQADGAVGLMVVGERRGSLVLECVGHAAAVFSLAICLREISSTLIRIVLEFQLSAKYVGLLRDASTAKEVARLHKDIRPLLTPPSGRSYEYARKLAECVKELRIFGESAVQGD
jgi:uncharacterized protein YjbI with pentapeptide repeats